MCTSVTECSPVLGIRSSRLSVFADWPAVRHTHLRSRVCRPVRPCRPPARALAPSAPSLFDLRGGPAGLPGQYCAAHAQHMADVNRFNAADPRLDVPSNHTRSPPYAATNTSPQPYAHICERALTHRALESKPIRSEQAIVKHPTKLNIPPLNLYK